MYLIVEGDNYGGDYPDEKFLNLPPLPTYEAAWEIVEKINKHCCNAHNDRRYWRVVEKGYKLQPGFEP